MGTSDTDTVKNILFQWVDRHYVSPRWMALAYYSAARNKALFVVFPLNLLIAFAWWIQDIWARAAHAPSWIDREVQTRVDHHIRSTRGVYRPRRLDDQFPPTP
jgi:hypothetical protein